MQFEAQARYYGEHYPEAAFSVILSGGQPVGRLYVTPWPEEIRSWTSPCFPIREAPGSEPRC
jgi:hypothetical protein